MRKSLVILLFFCFCSFSKAANEVALKKNFAFLSIRQAVHEAIANNPSLKVFDEKVNEIKTEIPLAKSLLYPQASMTFGGYQNKDSSILGVPKFGGDSYSQFGGSLKLNQTIYQMGSLANIRAAEKDVRIGKVDADISRRDLINSVIQAYYLMILRAKTVKTLEKQQQIGKESVEVTGKRAQSGRGQVIDSLQARTQFELLAGQLSTARNNFAVAAADLARLLGRETSAEDLESSAQSEIPGFTQTSLPAEKTAKIPEIERNEIQIDKIEDLRDVLVGQNRPILGFVGAYNLDSYRSSDLFSYAANSWSLGIQLTIPLFSGFSSLDQERALISQKSQAQFNRVTLDQQISFQLASSLKNLDTAHASIDSGDRALKLAVLASNEARRMYRLATIDFLQYLTIQQALAQAELSLTSSKFDYVVALTNYFVASGQDLETLLPILEESK